MAPRVPSKSSPPVRVPGEPAPPTDNMHGEEASRIQMISIIAKLSDAEDKIEAAKLPLQAAQKHRKTIIGLGKAAELAKQKPRQAIQDAAAGATSGDVV